ncbi:family 78 glycoside hydrolase catalytic domain [Gallintestinimicrobium sp.]|uniref:family 78 glycoside hydrolase catalytic domain n=1 Tax=Gallintestinimicrobium sp. TaxID=2981655 RepID=UPI00307BA77C
MKKEHWICGGAGCEAPLFRRSFWLDRTERFQSARLEICGLGYFLFYINGKRISDQELMPAMTDYASVLGCETTYPVWEERSAHRCRYLSFDLLPYLKAGENVLAVRLGNGWYHQTERIAEGKFVFGLPKLWFELTLTDADGRQEWIESDRQTLWHPGGLLKNNLFLGEVRDLRKEPEGWQYPGADLPGWKPAQPVHAPETLLEEQTCPPDRVIRKLYPVLIGEYDGRKIYDCRENIAGRVVLSCLGKKGECITVRHAEELAADGTLDFESAGGSDQLQQDHYICDGRIQTLHPLFCWHGFRYFETEGSCEVLYAEVIHTDVAVTSSFSCSDPVLNWLYEAYIRTQLDNYHGCIPSDCPHRERLGYTGDGQLTAETAMLLLDAKELYRKWYQDILDSQGAETGHIPHTAPFLGGGGGPGGWGCAVYQVPLAWAKIYGDDSLLVQGYDAILRWFDYMDAHSEKGLVVREEEGGWCLGDWCFPASEEKEQLPEAFINTFYYLHGLQEMMQISEKMNNKLLIRFAEREKNVKNAFLDAYFDPETGDFCEGRAAGNAYGLALGLGDERTKKHLVEKYEALGRFDTGIFGTSMLLEQLFSIGAGDLAVRLLTNDSEAASFAHMKRNGATTLWERWDGRESHNHPMFGACVRLLFTQILGIRMTPSAQPPVVNPAQPDVTAPPAQALKPLNGELQPPAVPGSTQHFSYEIRLSSQRQLTWAKGSIQTPDGILSVSWELLENGEKQVEWSLAPAGEDKVPTM